MTREEAITILKAHHMWTGEPQEIIDVRKENKALEMAIKALEQNESAEEWYKLFVKKLDEQEPIREFTEEEAKAYSKALDKMYKPTGFNVFNEPCDDAISRQAAIDAFERFIHELGIKDEPYNYGEMALSTRNVPPVTPQAKDSKMIAQGEPCEYYALCRHGRDENKLRANLGACDYCNEDSNGYVKPIEKNSHAFVRFGMNGWELSMKANGWHGSAKIRYCPMCGRDLFVK